MTNRFCRAAVLSTCLFAVAVPTAFGQAKGGFKPDQKVEVREGDEWSAATVVKQEGRKFQIRYADGTEEWVPAERVRIPGAAADTPVKPGATTQPAAKKPAEAFKVGEKVELKEASSWKPGVIKNRDGDLYLVIFDGWESQFHWQWLHVSCVRKIGSDKAGPRWAKGVSINNQGVAKAREEAKREFANIDQEVAAEEVVAKGGKDRSPFDPKAYDKPITEPVLNKIDDIVPGGGASKLSAFDPEPGIKTKLAERAYVLKGGAGDRWKSGPAVVMFGGTRAVTAYTSGSGSDSRTVSLESVDLLNGKTLGVVDADPLSMPHDLAPAGDRIVGVQHGFHGNTRVRLDLHTLKPGGKPEHLISFIPFAGEKDWKDVTFARFVGDGDHVLTASSGGTLILWDAAKATAIWRVKGERNSPPAVSPGGKQIAMLQEGALVVLDALSGNTLCRIAGDRSVGSLTFTPDGKRVVGKSGWSVACWDLEKGTVTPDIGIPAKGANGGIAALDGRFVLIGGNDVLDLEKKFFAWRYDTTSSHGAASEVQMFGRRAWTVVKDDDRLVLTGARLPHDAARKAADAAKVGQGLVLQPGGRMNLTVSLEATPEQQKKITEAMTAQLKDAGITIDPASPIKLVASTEQGKTSTQTYEVRQFGRPFDRSTETVSVTEKITRVYIEVDGKIAWESRTSSGGAPMMVHTSGNQSVNDAVQAGSKFNVAFLESVRVPAYVPRPSDTPWLGESTWGMSGISKDRAIAQAADVPAAAAAPGNGDGIE